MKGECLRLEIIWDPKEIEKKSFEIIEEFIEGYNFTPLEKAIVKRIIHTTGDPAIIGNIQFHIEATKAGLKALRKGANVFTDVNMLKAGINAKKLNSYGGEVFCGVADQEVAEAAKEWGITRSAAAMRLYGEKLDGAVIAIGNAPTALFEVLDLIEKDVAKPAMIAGTPVGFVGALESKELMIEKNIVPYMTVRGNRGGSPIAACMVNALLYFEGEE